MPLEWVQKFQSTWWEVLPELVSHHGYLHQLNVDVTIISNVTCAADKL